MSHLTHLHVSERARARRRYSSQSRREEFWQLMTLAFFALVVTAWTLASSGHLLGPLLGPFGD